MRYATLAALLVAFAANASNDPPPDPTTGKKGDTVGQVFDPATGKFVSGGQQRASGPAPDVSFRESAIWNAVQITGLHFAPQGASPVSEYGGALAYEVFTTPQWNDGLIAHLRVAAGYSAEQNRMLDVLLGIGYGLDLGPVTVMALGAIGDDSIWGGNLATLQVPSALLLGPELRAMVWPLSWASIDLYAARLFKLTGSMPDGSDVPAETRLGAALSFIPGGRGIGFSFGLLYADYGFGSATTANVAVRWGSR